MFEETRNSHPLDPITPRVAAMIRQCSLRQGELRDCPCRYGTECRIPPPELLNCQPGELDRVLKR